MRGNESDPEHHSRLKCDGPIAEAFYVSRDPRLPHPRAAPARQDFTSHHHPSRPCYHPTRMHLQARAQVGGRPQGRGKAAAARVGAGQENAQLRHDDVYPGKYSLTLAQDGRSYTNLQRSGRMTRLGSGKPDHACHNANHQISNRQTNTTMTLVLSR